MAKQWLVPSLPSACGNPRLEQEKNTKNATRVTVTRTRCAALHPEKPTPPPKQASPPPGPLLPVNTKATAARTARPVLTSLCRAAGSPETSPVGPRASSGLGPRACGSGPAAGGGARRARPSPRERPNAARVPPPPPGPPRRLPAGPRRRRRRPGRRTEAAARNAPGGLIGKQTPRLAKKVRAEGRSPGRGPREASRPPHLRRNNGPRARPPARRLPQAAPPARRAAGACSSSWLCPDVIQTWQQCDFKGESADLPDAGSGPRGSGRGPGAPALPAARPAQPAPGPARGAASPPPPPRPERGARRLPRANRAPRTSSSAKVCPRRAEGHKPLPRLARTSGGPGRAAPHPAAAPSDGGARTRTCGSLFCPAGRCLRAAPAMSDCFSGARPAALPSALPAAASPFSPSSAQSVARNARLPAPHRRGVGDFHSAF